MSSKVYQDMANRLVQIFTDDPILAMDFYCMASEIVDDFDDWGPMVAANEDGEYDESTAIVKLRRLRDEIIFRRSGTRPDWSGRSEVPDILK